MKYVARPKLLGNPSPANGVLTPDGEVSITFNEDIKASSLIKTENFVVTSKLNGSKVDHDVALQLTGAEGAQTEADIDLAARPFALNLWLNYTGAGQILSHGSDTGADFYNKIIRANTGRADDFLQYMFINQKVLSEFLLKYKLILLQNFYGILGISKSWFRSVHAFSSDIL